MAVFTVDQTHGISLRESASLIASSDGFCWSDFYASCQHEAPYSARFGARDSHFLVIHRDGPVKVSRYLDGVRCERVVAPGGMFLLPGGREFEVELGGGLSTVHLYLRPELIEAAASALCSGDPAQVELLPRIGEQDPVVEHLARALGELVESGHEAGIYADSLAMALACRLISHHSNRSTVVEDNGGLSKRTLARLREFIDARLDQPISVGELAALANLSPIHFSRKFKRSTGESPHQFIIGVRVEAAKRLLATDLSIAEIAFRCGFSHQEHLTRLFGARIGTTPAVYRKALRT